MVAFASVAHSEPAPTVAVFRHGGRTFTRTNFLPKQWHTVRCAEDVRPCDLEWAHIQTFGRRVMADGSRPPVEAGHMTQHDTSPLPAGDYKRVAEIATEVWCASPSRETPGEPLFSHAIAPGESLFLMQGQQMMLIFGELQMGERSFSAVQHLRATTGDKQLIALLQSYAYVW